MPTPKPKQSLVEAKELLKTRLEFADLLAKLPPKDRVNATKRISVLEASATPAVAVLWQRIACALMTLAPHAAKLVGRQTVQYYVADGKYRMQVYALEDLQDGTVTIYCPDILAEALASGLLAKPVQEDAVVYGIAGTSETLPIELLDRSTVDSAAHYKDMLGWNRKALRIAVPPAATETQVKTAELLCALAARNFPRVAPATEAATTKGSK